MSLIATYTIHAHFRAEDAHAHRLSLLRPQPPPVLGIATPHRVEDIDAHDLVLRDIALEGRSGRGIEAMTEKRTGKETRRKGKRNGAQKSTEKNDGVP